MVDDFHPDLRRIARFTPSGGLVRPRTLPINRMAAALLSMGGPRDVEVVALGAGSGVRVHRPANLAAPSTALLWIHGGCYVIGAARQDDKLCHRFAYELDIMVVSVEYRVRPSTPIRQHSMTARLLWIGWPHEPMSTPRASRSVVVAQVVVWPPRWPFELLKYPMLDDRRAFEPDSHPKSRRLMDQHINRFGWESYLRGAEPTQAVPARAADLTGLPPAWIGVGTKDLLFDECLEYAERLQEASVPCELEVVPGAFHGFDLFAKAAVSRSFFESQCAALRSALTG